MSEAKTIPAKYVFLNIVGFTHNRSVEAQAEIIQVLNSIVESVVKKFGITKQDVLFLPSGDGLCVALLNIESPYDIHLLIALNIIREVSRYNARTSDKMRRFEIHVGLNAYTDNFITDINGNRNIAGTGVSTASRVMSKADGNQILVSQAVYEELHYHEKYLSSFRSFKTKLDNNQEFSVHQFVESGHEGLNTAVPQSLQTAVRIEPPTVQPKTPSTTASRVGQVEFNTTKTAPAIPEISLPETQSTQTQSYLTGILAEQQAKTETQAGWIKPKTAPKPFLEEVVPQKNNHTFLWAALVLLIIGGASFGAWMFYGNGASVQKVNDTATEVVSETPDSKPVSSPTALPTVAPTETIAENTLQPNQTFTPTKSVVSETKPATEETIKSRQTASRQTAARRIVQPKAVKTTTAAQPKQQTAKAEKPKPAKKVTLDDLINGNR